MNIRDSTIESRRFGRPSTSFGATLTFQFYSRSPRVGPRGELAEWVGIPTSLEAFDSLLKVVEDHERGRLRRPSRMVGDRGISACGGSQPEADAPLAHANFIVVAENLGPRLPAGAIGEGGSLSRPKPEIVSTIFRVTSRKRLRLTYNKYLVIPKALDGTSQ